MAAVTTVRSKRNVAGARKYREFIITGADTNTLDTGCRNASATVPSVLMETCTITAVARSIVNGQLRLTFSASGPFTAVSVMVSDRF